MPRSGTILTIFVASPSDVSEERNRLEVVVDHLNVALARHTGVILEVLRWERDTSPAFGKDSQAVINSQIPQDFDIFIGILWHTIGTATGRAESGTLEEYELAKARYDEDQNSVRLMFYFKEEAPSSLADIDPDQLKSVQKFKSMIGEKALYSTFYTTEDFSEKVRNDLLKHVLDMTKENSLPDHEKGAISENDSCTDDDFDDGLFELEEKFEEEIDALSAVTERMAEAITDIGASASERTDELNSLKGDGKKIANAQERQELRTRMKRILKVMSGDMNGFVSRMKTELPLFRKHLDVGLKSFVKAIPIYLELDEERTDLKQTFTTVLESMDLMLESMEGFHESVHNLPKMTAAFSRSRKETEKVLRDVIEITRDGRESLGGALSLLP